MRVARCSRLQMMLFVVLLLVLLLLGRLLLLRLLLRLWLRLLLLPRGRAQRSLRASSLRLTGRAHRKWVRAACGAAFRVGGRYRGGRRVAR